MGSRSITETQRVEIIRLRVEGNLSTPTIARKVGVCNQSVYRILEPHPWARPLAQAFHGDAWTERDKARLRTLYPVAPKAQVMAALSNRNWESIVRQASTMGVRRDSKTASRVRATSGNPPCATHNHTAIVG
jgi:IS30 family transposase